MSKIELKPCPFCGGEASMRSGGPGCHFVQCDTCNATSDDHSKDTAAAKWNARVPDTDALIAELERDGPAPSDIATGEIG